MVRGYRTFKEFSESGESIATNILSDRLKRLQGVGIVVAQGEQADGRRVNYALTEKGIALAPVVLDLLIWAAKYEETGAPCAVIDHMENNREQILSEAYRRWLEKDPTPLLPRFEVGKEKGRGLRNERGSSAGRNAQGRIRAVVRRKT